MKLNLLDVFGIVLYFIATGIFALLTRRTATFSEFSVGNRMVPASMVFASLAATIIGPGFSVGITSKGYTDGYTFYLLALTYALQTVLTGIFFAPRLNNFKDCFTIGDVMGRSYGRFAHLLTGIVSVGLCIGFTAVMGKTAGIFLNAISGWPLWVCVLIVTMSTALFTFTGGVRAVIATDALHFSWYTLVIPAILLIAFVSNRGSEPMLAHEATALTQAGFSHLTGLQMIGIAVSFLLGETLIPPYTNRALAAKSERASRNGFIAAGLFCVIWLAIVASLGILARGVLGSTVNADDVFVLFSKRILPPGLFGLVLASIIAIVMSSQESVLNSASVSLVRDVFDIQNRSSDARKLSLSRYGVLLIAAVSVLVSVYSPSIIDGLLICYSIWAPTILLPFLLALYHKNTGALSGIASIIGGGLTSALWQTLLRSPFGVPPILAGLAVSTAAYGGAMTISRLFAPKRVNQQ